jgi:hypothetical protein
MQGAMTMETTMTVSLKQAKWNLLLGAAIFLGAALAAQAVSASAEESRESIYPQVEVAASIAQQGNDAVRQIREEAREAVRLTEPAPLTELTEIATEVAAR